MLHSVTSAAARLGTPVRTVQRYAHQLAFPQIGGTYVIEEPSPLFDQLSELCEGRTVKVRRRTPK